MHSHEPVHVDGTNILSAKVDDGGPQDFIRLFPNHLGLYRVDVNILAFTESKELC